MMSFMMFRGVPDFSGLTPFFRKKNICCIVVEHQSGVRPRLLCVSPVYSYVL